MKTLLKTFWKLLLMGIAGSIATREKQDVYVVDEDGVLVRKGELRRR